MIEEILPCQIFHHLSDKDILITPTRRLATAVMQAYDSTVLEKNTGCTQMAAWETPSIYSLKDWCAELWSAIEISGLDERYLISGYESLLLMESIIQHSTYATRILRPHTTAKLVLSGWKTLQSWKQYDAIATFDENIDQQAFKFFCEEYQKYLTKYCLIDETQLLDQIQHQFENNNLNSLMLTESFKLICYGFDDITPQLQSFLDILVQHKWTVSHVTPPTLEPKNKYLFPCIDTHAEIRAAALWAKEIIDQGKGKGGGLPKIGIILPDLPEHRESIIKIFSETFEGDTVFSPKETINIHYNLSSAIPLAQYGVVQIVFHILNLFRSSNIFAHLNIVFDSPYIKDSLNALSEYQRARQVLAAHLEEKGNLKNGLELFRKRASDFPVIVSLLQSLYDIHLKISNAEQQSFDFWRNVFDEVLCAVDWPGARPLSSIEHQAVARFYNFMDEFTQLYCIFENQKIDDILDKLHKYAANIPFQAENKGAPIQILGILEATGLKFDHLWVMSMHHENWPPKSEPSPFIPLTLQRMLLMPHASPKREYEFSKIITERLLQSATEIIVSYPETYHNNKVYPSEWVRELMLLPEKFQSKYLYSKNDKGISQQVSSIEFFRDFHPIALESHKQQAVVKGGSQIFVYQNQCPFKAFSKIRLKAERLEVTKVIDPRLRGTLLHECLHKIWMHLRTQESLVQMKDGILVLIEKVVTDVFSKHRKKYAIPSVLWDVEKERLMQLLQLAIHIDGARPKFNIVALEQLTQITIGPLTINVRIDRIDKIGPQQYLLIDYKTGQVNINDLIRLPLKSPQLPLYLNVDYSFNPTAAAWFVIRPEAVEYIGLSEDATQIGSIQSIHELAVDTHWNGLREQWSHELHRLADAFTQGELRVDPSEGEMTCRLCDLQSFCRIEDKKERLKTHG